MSSVIGKILKGGFWLRKKVNIKFRTPKQQQLTELKILLAKAQNTYFGKKFDFRSILSADDSYIAFQKNVPIYDYDSIFEQFWHRTLKGEADICWPEKVKYFALSSGTSGSASKRIPVTGDMIKAVQRVGYNNILAFENFNLNEEEVFGKTTLLIGGSTNLTKKENYFEGDVSGINSAHLPYWLKLRYAPGEDIAAEKDWNLKVEMIVENAPKWDIATIVGVPSWVQLILEKIIEKYNVSDIHKIWPNLQLYIHSGVNIEPYRIALQQLFGKNVSFIETYIASEGSFAYQPRPENNWMKFYLLGGIFYEFIPFDEENFDENGDVKPNAKTLPIYETQNEIDYAMLISTCSGAWRYLIGDVIRFKNAEENEFIITGRTKQFLSIVGEHLSIDNLNQAIKTAIEFCKINIKEFTVFAEKDDKTFAHRWFVACDEFCDKHALLQCIDNELKKLNDDYAVERESALKNLSLEVLPTSVFHQFLTKQGKSGAQIKFPRVLKGKIMEDWKKFIAEQKKSV